MHELRRPGRVPEDPALDPAFDPALDAVVDRARPMAADLDTDGDGTADTAVTTDGVDLVVLTDLDGDRFADQVLRIGPDAVVREAGPPPEPGSEVLDGLLGGAAAGLDAGH